MPEHTLCRSHRDPELGLRSTGAPPGNLNALEYGRYSHLLPDPELQRLADRILAQSGDVAAELNPVVQSLQARTGRDPLVTLLALRRVLAHLATVIAARTFSSELRSFLDPLPEPGRRHIRAIIRERVRLLGPEERVLILREAKKQLMDEFN